MEGSKEEERDQREHILDLELYKARFERKRRTRFAQIVAPAAFALLLIVNRTLNPEGDSFPGLYLPRYLYSVLTVMLLSVSGIGLLMFYLQTGFQRVPSELRYSYEIQENIKAAQRDRMGAEESKKIELVEHELNIMKEKVDRLTVSTPSPTLTLGESEQKALINALKARLEAETATQVYEDIKKKVADQAMSDERLKLLAVRFNETLSRLQNEVRALGRRGNLNLALGIVTTIIGLSILGYFVVQSRPEAGSAVSFTVGFLPRLSLVILIEVFAYFFLKLYKATLSEIRLCH